MSDTQVLLEKITALRQRLEQVQGLVDDAGSAAVSLVNDAGSEPRTVAVLEEQIKAGSRYDALLDCALRPLTPTLETPTLPTQLTARARQLVERGRTSLDRLRQLADDPLLEPADNEPLATWYRSTVAMTDTTLRMMGTFPDAPSVQLRLCEGIEATLTVIEERIARLTAIINQRREESVRVEMLADLLTWLDQGKTVEIEPFAVIAEMILADAQEGLPFRILHEDAERCARFIACHSINVGNVMARVMRHNPDMPRGTLDGILAALIHDAGMLRVPGEVLARPGPLDDTSRRVIESHARIGAEWAAQLLPSKTWLAETAAYHHERLDGTGYPAGLRESQIFPLTRLLAVCDVYAALCAPRPYRPARDPRTALTDTLMLADGGALDRFAAEGLLCLSFYPAGSAVEMADGAFGVVVAASVGRSDLKSPSRPVVALLTDVGGKSLPWPRYLDLSVCDGHSIVHSLPREQRRQVLGKQYPELV
jgi:HD-GYP domain-containing protein (c-di-GMP phosphodiesterase class II)